VADAAAAQTVRPTPPRRSQRGPDGPEDGGVHVDARVDLIKIVAGLHHRSRHVGDVAIEQVRPIKLDEPDAEGVLDALLPVYIESRIWNAMLQSAASEHASRQRSMKSASDNADKLIREYTRLANNARQSEITQQIAEIVGGADALAG
jgi:ATP synthase F1 gamma subunit